MSKRSHLGRTAFVYCVVCLIGCFLANELSAAPVRHKVAIEALRKREPKVRWSEKFLTIDVTWDGVPDAVVLGFSDGTTVVGVVEGPVTCGSRSWSTSILNDVISPGGSCGDPKRATIAAEPLRLDPEEFGCGHADKTDRCEAIRVLSLKLQEASARGSMGFRLVADDCDALHIYFDGTALRFWRR